MTTLTHMIENLGVLVCPSCGGGLEVAGHQIKCLNCDHVYEVTNNVPLLFQPNEWDSAKKDITEVEKAFYEETPFPNYEHFENVGDLVQKGKKGFFADLLNDQIPFNVRVLEVGCGTGQLSNFLGVAHRTVFGADMCVNSLRLGQEFKEKNGLDRVGFYQMNLFRPIFREESFPVVICNGVLHHTSDPFAGFQSISRLVKKDGYILVGLYNTYGRIITDIRRHIFNACKDRLKFLDPRLRSKNIGDLRKLTWFMDQYKNPHESKHTIGEVLKWFDQTGFEFVNSIPKATAFGAFLKREKLFKPNPKGSWIDHVVVQTKLMFKGSKEGGFFIMIGKRVS